jgi:hypothetical protein
VRQDFLALIATESKLLDPFRHSIENTQAMTFEWVKCRRPPRTFWLRDAGHGGRVQQAFRSGYDPEAPPERHA